MNTTTLAPDGAPPSVEIIGMTKTFGALRALDDVSIMFAPGSFHAILGENGAGKSTLVKCLMGYHRADSGRIPGGFWSMGKPVTLPARVMPTNWALVWSTSISRWCPA